MIHKYPHEITLIPVGPLTNIALAVSKDPSIAALVKNIVIMGGSITGGNVNGAAEANIYNDPEAAQIVFNAGWMVTMVGSDVGERTLITRKYLAELQASHGPQNDFIAKIAEFYLNRSEKSGYSGAAMYDPLAVGIALDPTLATLKEMHVDVETKGEFTRGETVANRHGLERKQRIARRPLRDRGSHRTEAECAGVPGFRCRPILESICQPGQREISQLSHWRARPGQWPIRRRQTSE